MIKCMPIERRHMPCSTSYALLNRSLCSRAFVTVFLMNTCAGKYYKSVCKYNIHKIERNTMNDTVHDFLSIYARSI